MTTDTHKSTKWWNVFPRGKQDRPSGTWPCNLAHKDHNCNEPREHGNRHKCACGFRWLK